MVQVVEVKPSTNAILAVAAATALLWLYGMHPAAKNNERRMIFLRKPMVIANYQCNEIGDKSCRDSFPPSA
jgi:hypothetical protein